MKKSMLPQKYSSKKSSRKNSLPSVGRMLKAGVFRRGVTVKVGENIAKDLAKAVYDRAGILYPELNKATLAKRSTSVAMNMLGDLLGGRTELPDKLHVPNLLIAVHAGGLGKQIISEKERYEGLKHDTKTVGKERARNKFELRRAFTSRSRRGWAVVGKIRLAKKKESLLNSIDKTVKKPGQREQLREVIGSFSELGGTFKFSLRGDKYNVFYDFERFEETGKVLIQSIEDIAAFEKKKTKQYIPVDKISSVPLMDKSLNYCVDMLKSSGVIDHFKS